MGISTSDGKYFETDLDMLSHSFLDYAEAKDNQSALQNASRIDSKPRTDVLPEGELPPIGATSGSNQNKKAPIERGLFNALTGADGEERYQLWPEKAVRETWDKISQGGHKLSEAIQGKRPMTMDEMVEFATEMSMNLAGGGVVTAPMRAAGVGSFGGNSGAARVGGDLLKRFDEAIMRGNAEDARTLWKELGMYRDPRDNMLKFEIKDTSAKFDSNSIDSMHKMAVENAEVMGAKHGYIAAKVGQVLQHDDLYKMYPEIKNANFFYVKDYNKSIAGAWYDTKNNTFNIVAGPKFKNESPSEQRGHILHEVQHLIQNIEGFARGGSPNMKPSKTLGEMASQIANEYKDLASKSYSGLSSEEKKRLKQLAKFHKEFAEASNKAGKEAYENYRKLGGEIESNNVDTRDSLRQMGMTEDQIGHPGMTEKFDPENIRALLSPNTLAKKLKEQ